MTQTLFFPNWNLYFLFERQIKEESHCGYQMTFSKVWYWTWFRHVCIIHSCNSISHTCNFRSLWAFFWLHSNSWLVTDWHQQLQDSDLFKTSLFCHYYASCFSFFLPLAGQLCAGCQCGCQPERFILWNHSARPSYSEALILQSHRTFATCDERKGSNHSTSRVETVSFVVL